MVPKTGGSGGKTKNAIMMNSSTKKIDSISTTSARLGETFLLLFFDMPAPWSVRLFILATNLDRDLGSANLSAQLSDGGL